MEKKLVRPGRRRPGEVALYDLENDIAETTNLADKYPDVVNRLTQLADAARRELGDDGRPGTGQRPAGLVEKPTARRLSANSPRKNGIRKIRTAPGDPVKFEFVAGENDKAASILDRYTRTCVNRALEEVDERRARFEPTGKTSFP